MIGHSKVAGWKHGQVKKNIAFLDDRLPRPEEIWPLPSSVSGRRKPPSWLWLLLVILGLWIILVLSAPSAAKGGTSARGGAERSSESGGGADLPDPCGLEDMICDREILYAEKRIVTAYNVGISEQTDSDSCVGASGRNLCTALRNGEKICAATYPFGTRIYVPGYGYCKVEDRLNRKYAGRIDIAFPLDQLKEALAWGIQEKKILILK